MAPARPKRSLRLASALAVVMLWIAGTVHAEDYPVSWSTSPNVTSITAECGDTITLTWAGTHDVAYAATGTCPTTVATSLAPISTGGIYKYTVKANDIGSFWLICTVSAHCAAGQNLKVTATCPTTTNTTTTHTTTNGTSSSNTTVVFDAVYNKPGGGKSYYTLWRARKINDLQLTCNDDIQFFWNSTVTQFKHSLLLKQYVAYTNMSQSCSNIEADNTTKVQLVPQLTVGNYTWQPTENGDYFFICQVGQHCVNGQRVRVTVTGCSRTSSVFKPAGTAPSSATPSPSPSPKKSLATVSMPLASMLVAMAAVVAFWTS